MKTCLVPTSISVQSGIAKALWLKSNAGVTLSGVGVTNWLDQSGNNHNFSQAAAANQFQFYAQGVVSAKAPVIKPVGGALDNHIDNARFMTSDDALNIVPPYTVVMCIAGLNFTDNHQDYVLTAGFLNFSIDSRLIGGSRPDCFQPFNTVSAGTSGGSPNIGICGMAVHPVGFTRNFNCSITPGGLIGNIGDGGAAANTDSALHLLGSNGFAIGGGDTPTASRYCIIELIVYPQIFSYDGVTWAPADLQTECNRLQNAYG